MSYTYARIADHFIDTFLTGPLYAAAFMTGPSQSDGLTDGHEPSDPNYVRPVISFDLPSFGTIQTTTEIRFPVATIPWGEVQAIGVCGTQAGNTYIWYGSFPNDLAVNMGDQFQMEFLNIRLF
jgi:hypothetical protein